MKCTNPSPQHDWLQRYVGEWTVTSRSLPEPDEGGETWTHDEVGVAVGAFWVVVEGRGEPWGEPYHARHTLGYSPEHDEVVATWVDSMTTTLWNSAGKLDLVANAVTLEAEGPDMHDPTRRARYRDHVEWLSDDHRRMTSSMLGDDGTWTAFMRMDAMRKG